MRNISPIIQCLNESNEEYNIKLLLNNIQIYNYNITTELKDIIKNIYKYPNVSTATQPMFQTFIPSELYKNNQIIFKYCNVLSETFNSSIYDKIKNSDDLFFVFMIEIEPKCIICCNRLKDEFKYLPAYKVKNRRRKLERVLNTI